MSESTSDVLGTVADGFEPVRRVFAQQLRSGAELGAAIAVYHRGRRVVDLWGGLADHRPAAPALSGHHRPAAPALSGHHRPAAPALSGHPERGTPWAHDSRVVLFSITKGLAAMGLVLLADRGLLDYDAPVTTYWPEFGRSGKSAITVRSLLNHRAGLPVLDVPFTLAECTDPSAQPRLIDALEQQRPLWEPDHGQGYHAITYGMYAGALFERIAKEPLGEFLARELFTPLGADVSLGTPESIDPRIARLYPPTARERLGGMGRSMLRRAVRGRSEPITEARIARTLLGKDSLPRRAFLNPSAPNGIASYDEPSVWRSSLAWASATGSADGVARAYLPFSLGGEVDARRYVRASTLHPIYDRQGWSDRDAVLQKPLGWSQGFLKEEPHVFSPTRESFGHPGIGGALGWCDPVRQLTIGYVMNRLDWRVRSPRALALCRAIYECEPVRRG